VKSLVVNLVRTVSSVKFICWCWRNPWCDFTSYTHWNVTNQLK